MSSARPPAIGGPYDVLVRIRAVSLNYRDIAVARAAIKRVKRIVPVSDGAGEVIAVGDRVTRVKVGDRVAAAFFPTWIDRRSQERASCQRPRRIA